MTPGSAPAPGRRRAGFASRWGRGRGAAGPCHARFPCRVWQREILPCSLTRLCRHVWVCFYIFIDLRRCTVGGVLCSRGPFFVAHRCRPPPFLSQTRAPGEAPAGRGAHCDQRVSDRRGV